MFFVSLEAYAILLWAEVTMEVMVEIDSTNKDMVSRSKRRNSDAIVRGIGFREDRRRSMVSGFWKLAFPTVTMTVHELPWIQVFEQSVLPREPMLVLR